ncbi:SPRY domain-containing protein [Phthorimaea operculella]|nr:SPRY domain-containing protein [Phthorimaea operculella]
MLTSRFRNPRAGGESDRVRHAKPYCTCWNKRSPLTWRELASRCTCGEDTEVSEWKWEPPNDSTPSWVVVSEDQRLVTFHPFYSSGTAAIKGDTPLKHNYHYYWEIKMLTDTYGTDIMVGLGTNKVNISEPQFQFRSLLGSDAESYGLSYTGAVRHNATVTRDSAGFCRGTIIGVRVDLWRGTLEFYINRRPQGVYCVSDHASVCRGVGLSYTGAVRHNATVTRDSAGFCRGTIIGVRVDLWRGTLEFYINRRPQGVYCVSDQASVRCGVGLSYTGAVRHNATVTRDSAGFCRGTIIGVRVDLWRGMLEFYINRRPQGLSYTGAVRHNATVTRDSAGFCRGTIIGVRVDLWRGTLEFYINRRPQGLSYTGAVRHNATVTRDSAGFCRGTIIGVRVDLWRGTLEFYINRRPQGVYCVSDHASVCRGVGLSYTGAVRHNATVTRDSAGFCRGTIIGVRVDLWRGMLEFYINRRPQGLSYTGAVRHNATVTRDSAGFCRGTIIGVRVDLWRGTLEFYINRRPQVTRDSAGFCRGTIIGVRVDLWRGTLEFYINRRPQGVYCVSDQASVRCGVGLSYTGAVRHNATVTRDSAGFCRGTIIGVRVDLWRGMLEFYINRRPQGVYCVSDHASVCRGVGLSYTGAVRHNATVTRDSAGFCRGTIIGVRVDLWRGTLEFYINRRPQVTRDSAGFCRGTIIGVRVDLWRGTLEFYINRRPQGISFYNLRRHQSLFPMMCSTAAQSSMRLIYAASWSASLLVDSAKILAASVRKDAKVKVPPGLWYTLKNQFWLTLPTEGKFWLCLPIFSSFILLNLHRHQSRFPMMCSTAAQSSMRLIYAASWSAFLLVDSAKILAASVRKDAKVKVPPGLWYTLKNQFWLTLPTEGKFWLCLPIFSSFILLNLHRHQSRFPMMCSTAAQSSMRLIYAASWSAFLLVDSAKILAASVRKDAKVKVPPGLWYTLKNQFWLTLPTEAYFVLLNLHRLFYCRPILDASHIRGVMERFLAGRLREDTGCLSEERRES